MEILNKYLQLIIQLKPVPSVLISFFFPSDPQKILTNHEVHHKIEPEWSSIPEQDPFDIFKSILLASLLSVLVLFIKFGIQLHVIWNYLSIHGYGTICLQFLLLMWECISRIRRLLENCFASLILLVVSICCYSRLLGKLFTLYLQRKLKTDSGGFDIHVQCISFVIFWRLGQVEVNFIDTLWKNPPHFTKTPYFLRIGRVSVVVDARSLWQAWRDPSYSSPVRVKSMTLYSGDVFIEKGDGLNINDSLDGKVNELSLLGRSHLPSPSSSPDPTPSRQMSTSSFTFRRKSFADSKISSPSPSASVSSLDRRASASSLPVVTRIPLTPNHSASRNFMENFDSDDEELTHTLPISQALDQLNYRDQSDNEEDENDQITSIERKDSRRWYFFSSHPSQKKSVPPSVPSPPSSHSLPPIDSPSTSSKSTKLRRLHWGFPYLLLVNGLRMQDFSVHAQDLFSDPSNPHSHSLHATAIHIDQLDLPQDRLTDKPVNRDQGPQGIFIDDLFKRVMKKLVKKLVLENKTAMLSMLTSGSIPISETTSVLAAVARKRWSKPES